MHLETLDNAELRASCRKVLTRNATSEHIRELVSSSKGTDDAFWNTACELGWTTIAVPEEFDGIGQGLVELAILAEEFGRAMQPSPIIASSLVTWIVNRFGTSDQRADLLPRLGDGRAIATYAVTGVADTQPPLELVSGTVSGELMLVSDAHTATHLLVDVVVNGAAVLALLDMQQDGISVVRRHTLDLARRYFTVSLDQVPVGEGDLITAAEASSDLFRAAVVLQCAESVGVAQKLVDMTVDYVSTRNQFGRPIGSFQAIKHRIADMYIELQGSLVATEEAASALEAGHKDATSTVHVLKSWAGRATSELASEALQLHGGIAFTWEHDLHFYLRRAKVNELLLGSPGWHEERLFELLVTPVT